MKKRMTVSLEFARFLWSTSSAVTYAFRACAVALDIFDDELDKLEQGMGTWTLVMIERDFVAERLFSGLFEKESPPDNFFSSRMILKMKQKHVTSMLLPVCSLKVISTVGRRRVIIHSFWQSG